MYVYDRCLYYHRIDSFETKFLSPHLTMHVAKKDDELNFKKGDTLHIIEKEADGWWYAESKETGKKGYIPSNYGAIVKSSPEQ